MTAPQLIGDVGATNARFARVVHGSAIERVRVYACEDYRHIEDAIEAYLAEDEATPRPLAAAVGIAGPVAGDRIALTNHPWSFSTRALQQTLRLDRLHIVNDFAANALAIPHLTPDTRTAIGGGAVAAAMPIGIIGPGSGLGVSGLTPAGAGAGAGWRVIDGEGGHATMAAATDREAEVLDRMRSRFDHVSAERILSGPGLVNLYNTLAEIDGIPAVAHTPAQITDPETDEHDPLCREAVALFCAMLGTVAGNLALTIGARGGVYIAGGIVPKLGARFAASGFRRRFEDKGRMRPYLEAIPTFVITHPIPAFLGLAALLAEEAAP
jgi:glucokinase